MIGETMQAPVATFDVVCIAADGTERWRETVRNTVTTEGKNDLLTKYFKGSAYTAAWYALLISSVSYSALAAGDTAAQINGTNSWKEANTGAGANTPTYSQANRPALTFGTASAGSLATSSASAFSITGTGTIKGAGCVSTDTIGGTTGVLYNVALFGGGDRAVINGDTVNVSVTLTVA